MLLPCQRRRPGQEIGVTANRARRRARCRRDLLTVGGIAQRDPAELVRRGQRSQHGGRAGRFIQFCQDRRGRSNRCENPVTADSIDRVDPVALSTKCVSSGCADRNNSTSWSIRASLRGLRPAVSISTRSTSPSRVQCGTHLLRFFNDFHGQVHDLGVCLQLLTAAMRNVSIVNSPTRRFASIRKPAASFATVVVLPTPVGPTRATTRRSPG